LVKRHCPNLELLGGGGNIEVGPSQKCNVILNVSLVSQLYSYSVRNLIDTTPALSGSLLIITATGKQVENLRNIPSGLWQEQGRIK
jgi:hypothetical protein